MARLEDDDNNNKRSIAKKLTLISRQLRNRFNQRVESDGVTASQWTVVAAVSSRPGMTQRSIAEILGVTEVSAGRLIDRLCADGYLKRTPHPADRRAYCIDLTPEAEPLLQHLAEIAAVTETEAFAGFTEEDLERFEQLLDALDNNMRALPSARSTDHKLELS